MANRTIRVTLAPGHVVSLASDAPDIGSLVKTIVEIREEFDPAHVRVNSNFEGFDEKSFQEIVVEAANDFINAMQLDKDAYDKALEELKAGTQA